MSVFRIEKTKDYTVMSNHHLNTNVINENTSIDIFSALSDMSASLETLGTGELFLLVLETAPVSLSMKILSVCITVVIFGRMIEIALLVLFPLLP